MDMSSPRAYASPILEPSEGGGEPVLTWAVAVAVVAGLSLLAALLFQVVQQQGRILLRLDGIEGRLRRPDQGDGLQVAHHAGAHAADGVEHADPLGLPPGTLVAPFALPDLDGRAVRLEDFRGRRVLLAHWSPECGFCDLVAPELAALQHDRRHTELVLVSWGDRDANRTLALEHGLDCPILLLDGAAPPEPFTDMGTPAAYLLDEDGRVTRPVAIGADEVAALAREASRRRTRLRTEKPLHESRIERDGLKAGTPAPAFALPDVRGGSVALEDFRGRRVLLVFSDPDCGPCQDLAPGLAALDREHRDDGLQLIMVGRGDPQRNRAKATEHGIEFPVVLQDRWKLSKEYGIFATPVGFLIGEDGVIERDVATGGEQILALARQGLRKERTDGRTTLR
jgi:peroxiredoxin